MFKISLPAVIIEELGRRAAKGDQDALKILTEIAGDADEKPSTRALAVKVLRKG